MHNWIAYFIAADFMLLILLYSLKSWLLPDFPEGDRQ